MFDRLPDPNSDPRQLSFRKDDILYIDNTMYQGTPGQWSAFLVGSDGIPDQDGWGVVPSKYKVEEELVSKKYIQWWTKVRPIPLFYTVKYPFRW